jgi:hypothetical protein
MFEFVALGSGEMEIHGTRNLDLGAPILRSTL